MVKIKHKQLRARRLLALLGGTGRRCSRKLGRLPLPPLGDLRPMVLTAAAKSSSQAVQKDDFDPDLQELQVSPTTHIFVSFLDQLYW